MFGFYKANKSNIIDKYNRFMKIIRVIQKYIKIK